MVLILYGIEGSPPVRAVLFTLNALGLEFKLKKVNTLRGEQKTEEYLKKNPTHTIPILEDEEHIIVDSHAISAYLVRKYGNDDSLYPKDFKQRAIVDQRLHFDSGVLFPTLRGTIQPLFMKQETIISQSKLDAFTDSYNFLETFLEHNYVAGDNITIADFSILPTVTSMEIIVPIDINKYPKLSAWKELMMRVPYYERANELGLAVFAKNVSPLVNKE